MTQVKKTEAPERETALDRLAAQLRSALKCETTNIIEIGNLLIESRKHLEHGDWQEWLAKNFDLSYRTARRYESAAEYVASKLKCATVALLNFENLSPSVLYSLAAGGQYSEQEEAAILAATREGRVDEDAAEAIRWKLEQLAYAAAADDAAAAADAQEDDDETTAREDPEITAILDGPPPAVPPPAPIPPPPDFALQDFDQAISALKRPMTKPAAQFAQTIHSTEDLENVEDFIYAVKMAIRCPTP
jgi:hypothetical protein